MKINLMKGIVFVIQTLRWIITEFLTTVTTEMLPPPTHLNLISTHFHFIYKDNMVFTKEARREDHLSWNLCLSGTKGGLQRRIQPLSDNTICAVICDISATRDGTIQCVCAFHMLCWNEKPWTFHVERQVVSLDSNPGF